MTNTIKKNFEAEKNIAWYKQKWPWLILSLPIIAVVAGIITYQIADNNPASLVKDDYFKEGLAINKSLEKRDHAKKLGIKAEITIDKESQLISINLFQLKVDTPLPASLSLTLSHPTQENEDKMIQLSQLSNNQYVAEMPQLKQANWHVQLSDNQNTWVLKSRWNFPQENTVMMTAEK